MEPIAPTGPPAAASPATTAGERTTRKPMVGWDRSKLLVLFLGVWVLMVWAAKSDNPIVSWEDAVREQVGSGALWLALAGLEAVRQIHYLISERSAGWHAFWTEKVFGAWNRRVSKMNDWKRYRVGRALKALGLLAVLAFILGKVFDVPPQTALFELPATVWSALPFIIQMVFYMLIVVMQFVAIFWFLSKGGVEVYMPDDLKTRFSDVWGQDAVLDRVKENMVFLEDPEAIERKGGYVPGGILLWGPPGTGKTLMAEAVAGETGKPFVFVEPSAFINMFMGVGPLKVKGLFRKLRKLATRYGGVIVFFDEADSLGNRGALAQGGWSNFGAAESWATSHTCNGLGFVPRATSSLLFGLDRSGKALENPRPGIAARIMVGGMGGGGGGMGTLQALLAEISGLKKPRGFINRVVRRLLGMKPKPPPKYRMLIMMATNMPQALDEALLRPGRIDRIYKVGYPSKEGRTRTYQGYLAKVRHELTPADIEKLATITPYATGAGIKDMVNEALVVAIRAGREVITWADILRAKQLKEHGLPDDSEYIQRERHAVAVHEACHAVTAYRLARHEVIDIATIERRGDIGGFVSSIPPEEQFVQWRSEREIDIVTFLASLAGERLFFEGDNSAGVGSDLRNATRIATMMEGLWGMGSTIGSRAITLAAITGRTTISEDGADRAMLDGDFGHRIEAKLTDLYDRAWELLVANRLEVFAVAHALETHKTLSGDDVAAIIDGHKGPLIDGRKYHQPEFAALAEDYHRLALDAHRDHARVPIALPRLVQGAKVDDEPVPVAIWATSEANGSGGSMNGGGAAPAG